jgi:hypothetical protein
MSKFAALSLSWPMRILSRVRASERIIYKHRRRVNQIITLRRTNTMIGCLPALRGLSRSRMERGDADRTGPHALRADTDTAGSSGNGEQSNVTVREAIAPLPPCHPCSRDADEIVPDRPGDEARSSSSRASRQRPGTALRLSSELAITPASSKSSSTDAALPPVLDTSSPGLISLPPEAGHSRPDNVAFDQRRCLLGSFVGHGRVVKSPRLPRRSIAFRFCLTF